MDRVVRPRCLLRMLFRRLAVFVLAAEWGGPSCRLAFELFDAFLQRLEEFAQLLVILLERLIFPP